jgi:hypothetical protein
MKRSLVAILAIVYFVISSGVVVNIHYCMGKMSSAKLQASVSKSCGCGKKMESKKGCCKTEQKLVKLEDAQKASYADFAIQAPVSPLVTEFNLLQAPSYTAQDINYPQEHSPPDISKQDTYLHNCVFRI